MIQLRKMYKMNILSWQGKKRLTLIKFQQVESQILRRFLHEHFCLLKF